MSKRSDGVASAASIEDAFCEWRGKLFRNPRNAPASEFHACMKIRPSQDTKEAPLYEQKERWRSQRGEHRRCDS